MNKAELVARVAKDSGLTKADAGRALDAALDNVTKALKKGEKVTLVGFGTFGVSRRRARAGRNPQTGALIKISARRVPKFTAGKELKSAVR
ncbi:MAG TPA: HU family DNA-binding protein [Vicinamibacteria bacterium]|jgi:DNA-binding protein HU-beta|nr:HU family DNA-binding protein [Vicinamibacteria bacterium]